MKERHIRWLLVFLLVGQFTLLSAQIRDPAGAGSILEGVLLRLVAPISRAVESLSRGLVFVSHEFALRRALIDENRRLRAEAKALDQEVIRGLGLQETVDRLTEATEYAARTGTRLQAADIVLIDHNAFFQTMVVFTGDGRVERNQPVVAARGLVGRIVATAGPYAKVQLITDRSASVGGMIVRTRRQGVVRGAGRGSLEIDFVPLQADVRIGDRVSTAGIDGIYPRGVPVGSVLRVEPGNDLFHRIYLRPAVDFGILDEVYVLKTEKVPADFGESER